jgi:excisionase family DNA binding protein
MHHVTFACMKTQILLSKRDAAEALSVSLRTIDYLIASKQLAVTRIGKRVLVSRTALEHLPRHVVVKNAMSGTAQSRPIDRILDMLENVQPSGKGWTARCPAHGGPRNSLRIAEGEDGRVLLECHEGCHVDDIAAELGLHLQELFPCKMAADEKR